MKVFWIAYCVECDMIMPFGLQAERDAWAVGHGNIGHTVKLELHLRCPSCGYTENATTGAPA